MCFSFEAFFWHSVNVIRFPILFWKVEQAKNLVESVSFDYPVETEETMLNSSTFCKILLTESVFIWIHYEKNGKQCLKTGFLPKIYYEILNNLAKSIRNFRRKSNMCSVLGRLDPPPPPSWEDWVLVTEEKV
jgi:hypothetical protein